MNLNEYVLANHQTALELLRTLCLIPSPSHHEETVSYTHLTLPTIA